MVLVPLAVDPFGADTLTAKLLLLALLGLGLALSEAGLVLGSRRGWLVPTPSEALMAALGLWATASLAWAETPDLGLLGAASLLALPAVARAVRTRSPDPRSARHWMGRLVLVAVAAALIDSAAILMFGKDLTLAERKYASWLFTHNNMAATYAAILIPIAACMAVAQRKRWPWLLALGVLLGYLVVLRSRSSLAAALAGLAVLAVMQALRSWWRPPGRRTAGTLAAVVALALALPFWDGARGVAKGVFYQAVAWMQALGVGSLGDSLFRSNLWRRSIDLSTEAPFTGVGAGNFMVAYSRFDFGRADIPHAHNDALQLLVELGLPGMALFVGLAVLLLWRILQLLARFGGDPRASVTVAGLASALVVFAIVGWFEVPLDLGANASVLAVLVGLVGGLDHAPRRLAVGRLSLVAPVVGGVALAGLAVVLRHVPASAWYAQANQAWVNGDLDGARNRLQLLADLHLGGHLPHKSLGQLAWMAGDWEAAVVHYRAARRRWPYGADLMVREGDALLALGRNEEALEVLRRAYVAQRSDPDTIIGLLRALERTGRLDEAISRAEFLVRSQREPPLEVVGNLARLWSRKALAATPGPEQVFAWTAARHFYALLLQDGAPEHWPVWAEQFKHLTHELQKTPGAPDAWWAVYQRFRSEGGWPLPHAALWSAWDGDAVRLLPGWKDAAGPPLPRRMR